jgi:hypothetical protein
MLMNYNFAYLYGCGTLSPKLKEERRIRVVENGKLKRKFGPNKDKVMGKWRKKPNE